MNINYSTIAVVVIALLILGFLYLKKYNDEKGKEEIKKFLNTLYDDFEKAIIDYIEKLDNFSLNNLALAEQQIIKTLIDILWDKAVNALKEYVTDPVNKAIISRLLTREYIEEFIKQIFEQSTKVQTVYTSRYNNAILAANKEAILLEAEANKLNTEIDKNTPEDFREVKTIEPDRIINAEGEIINKEIIEPHEEELEVVNPEKDNSIEIIE